MDPTMPTGSLPPFEIGNVPAFAQAGEGLFEPSMFDDGQYLGLEQGLEVNETTGDAFANGGSSLIEPLPHFQPFDMLEETPASGSVPGGYSSDLNAQNPNEVANMNDINSMSQFHDLLAFNGDINYHAGALNGEFGVQQSQPAGMWAQQQHDDEPVSLYPVASNSEALNGAGSWSDSVFGEVNEQDLQYFHANQSQSEEVTQAPFGPATDVQKECEGSERIPASSTALYPNADGGFFEYMPESHTFAVQNQSEASSGNTKKHQYRGDATQKTSAATQPKGGPPSAKKNNSLRQTSSGSSAKQSKVNKRSKGKPKFTRRALSKFPEISAVMEQLQKAADRLNERDDIEPAGHTQPPATNGLYFASSQAAAMVNKITYWEPPADDESIPTTQADTEACVVRILASIKNNQGCLRTNENKDTSSFIKRWADGADFFPATALEAVAWKVVQLAIDVHRQGWTDPIPEPKLREDIYYSMLFTFEDRIKFIENVLSISKSTCEDLIKGNRLHEIVGCPHVVFERIHGNNKTNKEKSGRLSTQKVERDENRLKRKRADEEIDHAVESSEQHVADQGPSQPERPKNKQRKTTNRTTAKSVTSGTHDMHTAQAIDAHPEIEPVDRTDSPLDGSEVADVSQPTVETISNASQAKRSIDDVDGDARDNAPSPKRPKKDVCAKAPKKAKAKSATS